MAVMPCRQSEMSAAAGGIPGLFHGPQQQAADQRLGGLSFHSRQDLLHLGRGDLLLMLVHRDPLAPDEGQHIFHLVAVGIFMGPVQKRNLPLTVLPGHRLIGQKHEILYNPGGHIGLVCPDFHRMSLLVQKHLAFRKIKVNGPSPGTIPPEKRGEVPHLIEQRHQLLIGGGGFLIAFQNLFHRRVSHPAVHPDHRLRNLMINDPALAVDGHQAAERQPVLPLIQGADSVGEPRGQHGDHPVHQINAGSPFQGLPVQGASPLNVIAHIRDMHAQMIDGALPGQGNSVVQILGVLPVDGNHRPAAQIHPSLEIPFQHMIRHPLGLVYYLFRELHGQLMGSGHGQHIHAGLPGGTQNLLDPALRTFLFSAVGSKTDHHLIPVFGFSAKFFGDKDILLNLRVVGNHETEISSGFIGSHHLGNAVA